MNEILLSNTSEVDVEEPEITPYNPAPSYFASGEEDDLLEPVDDFQEKSSKLGAPPVQLGEVMREVRGQRLGNFICQFCDKSFRYVKAFNTHIKQHKRGEICKSGNKRRYTLKRKKPVPEENTYAIEAPDEPMEEQEDEEQAPYDSLSPYGSPARFEQPAREDSPDLGMMMLSNFHNGDNGTSETPKRIRKQRLQPAELSPEVEIPEKVQPRPSTSGGSRGRGRPRKNQVRAQPEQAEMEEPSPFADFCEVDVSRVLKKSIFDNDSFSQSAASTTRSRSRSASVELIDDVDIFGSVLPDSGAAKPKPKSAVSTTFTCSEPECGKKFHLRANLKKHLREVHGSI